MRPGPAHRFHLHLRCRLPEEGEGAALILPTCNTEAMNLHLVEIAATVAPGALAVLLVDQAGWHLSTGLVVPSNVTIMALPPKCPELNPVENVWQFLRDNWLSNRVFKSYDDLVDHCCVAWNKLVNQPWRNHVHRIAPLGAPVLINGTRYKSRSDRKAFGSARWRLERVASTRLTRGSASNSHGRPPQCCNGRRLFHACDGTGFADFSLLVVRR